jgi:hypothetical protein
MSEQVKVIVFGIKDQAVSCGCCCNGGCGPAKTMGDIYKDFTRFLSGSRMRNRIDIQFVDVIMDDMGKYEYVLDALNQGLTLPLTSINGDVKFYGGIDSDLIYDAIRKSA